MSTLGDTMSTLGGLVRMRKATTRFRGFLFSHILRLCSCICWPLEVRQFVKISLSGSQSPDPNTFLFLSLIKKSLVSKCPVGMLQDE